MEKIVPIRSISRGLAVLQAINRHRSLTLMDIAKESRVPYPTACRILQTLLLEGLVEREPSRKRYRPTALVRSLATGFQDEDDLVLYGRPLIAELGRQAVWPISLCTRVGAAMMVRDSTHASSPLTFQIYHPGYTLPILECAGGKAYLAFAPEEERALILEGIERQKGAGGVDPLSLQLARSGGLFEEIRSRGFAVHGRQKHTATPGKTSSLAAPVMLGGRPVATISLVFFASSMSLEKAIETYSGEVMDTAAALASALASGKPPPREDNPSRQLQEAAEL